MLPGRPEEPIGRIRTNLILATVQYCFRSRYPLTISSRDQLQEFKSVLLELDVLGPLVLENGLSNQLLKLTTCKNGKLGHDLKKPMGRN